MKHYCFELKASADMDEAWDELQDAGVQVLYSTEDENGKQIFGLAREELPPLKLIANYQLAQLDSIDWQEQWETHGADFHDGFVHLNVAGRELKLEPGPGFGDLSHPSTRLVVDLMEHPMRDQVVIDLGCGSGILSLCAAALGARQVIGIDIEPCALDHARRNAVHNGWGENIRFCLPAELGDIPNDAVLLMNMIRSEQIQAIESLSHLKIVESITSGILVEERDAYMALTTTWGWSPIEEKEQEGWLGFRFRRN